MAAQRWESKNGEHVLNRQDLEATPSPDKPGSWGHEFKSYPSHTFTGLAFGKLLAALGCHLQNVNYS